MTRQWQYRQYKAGDERGLLNLYRLVFGTELSAEHWEWKYNRNPAGQALIIVAESEEGIVGQCALLPRSVKIGDSVSVGSLAADAMVHPGYRGQGIFVTLHKQAYELAARRGIQFAYAFPNRNSYHACITRLGCTNLYKGIPLWVKPLNLENILRKRFVDSRFLASLGSKVGNIAMRILYRSQRSTPACSIKEISSFDPRFDFLWNKASRNYEIMVVRDETYLTWGYIEKPGHDYVVLIAENRGDLLGYVVLRCMEEFGLQIGFIVDILTIPEEPRVSLELIGAAVNYFELSQMDMASCLMLPNTCYAHSLKQAGFIRAPNKLLPQDMYLNVRSFTPSLPTDFLADPNNWFISWGDHDVI